MTPCIEWTGAKTYNGYGLIRRGGKNHRLPRYVWTNAIGAIPAGMLVLHRCDNPACYNLLHLFLGTPKDNSQDMVRKGRGRHQRQTHCRNGHPLAGDNLSSPMTSRGWRRCLECGKLRAREYRIRKRGGVAAA